MRHTTLELDQFPVSLAIKDRRAFQRDPEVRLPWSVWEKGRIDTVFNTRSYVHAVMCVRGERDMQ